MTEEGQTDWRIEGLKDKRTVERPLNGRTKKTIEELTEVAFTVWKA